MAIEEKPIPSFIPLIEKVQEKEIFGNKVEPFDVENDVYNPYKHRNPEKPNSTFGALIHILKGSVGTGILAIPNAFNNAGLLFGSSQKSEKRLQISQLVLLFIANTFHDICNDLFGWTMSVRMYMLIVMVPILLIGQIRYLKYLTPFSGIGFFFTSMTLGIVLYHIFKDPLVIDDKPLVASVTKWPFFFTTMAFAMSGITVITSVENSMKHPEKLLGKPCVLIISTCIITIFYFAIGFFGFARFGSLTRGSITLNLPTDEWSGIVGQILIGLSIFNSFGLIFYVAAEILFKKIGHRIKNARNIKEIVIRTFTILTMVGVGLAVPDVGIFISLVGAFFSSGLSIFLPAFLDTVFRQSHGGFGSLNWILWKNVFIMLFSFATFCIGTFQSITKIIETYQ